MRRQIIRKDRGLNVNVQLAFARSTVVSRNYMEHMSGLCGILNHSLVIVTTSTFLKARGELYVHPGGNVHPRLQR